MGCSSLDQSLPDLQFQTLRGELMRASTLLSSEQALNLADLLHTIIRMRKPCRPLRDLDELLLVEARAFRTPQGPGAAGTLRTMEEEATASSWGLGH